MGSNDTKNYTLNAKNVEKIAQLLRDYPEQTRKALYAAMVEATAYVEARIKLESPAVTSTLRDSWTSKVNSSDDGVTGTVGTASMYALPVELGSKPHTPPLQPIKDWVVAVLGIEDNEDEGDDIVDKIAWGIVGNIRKKGTEGQFTVKEVVEDKDTEDTYNRIVERHLKTVINKNG